MNKQGQMTLPLTETPPVTSENSCSLPHQQNDIPHKVQHLMLYTENTQAFYNLARAIYLSFKPTDSKNTNISILSNRFKPFLEQAIASYKKEIGNLPETLSEDEKKIFCLSYAEDYYSYDIRQLLATQKTGPATKTIPAAINTTSDNNVKTRTVDRDIIALLSQARSENNSIFINTGMLDRKTYEKVDAIMNKMGGKWNSKKKAHVFSFDPTEKLDLLLMAGVFEIPDNYGFFPTPADFAEQHIIPLADLHPDMTVFEPEAGNGNLADAAARIVGIQNVTCCELQEANQDILRTKGYKVIAGNFLNLAPGQTYQRIIMNPPFAKFADIMHVTHALKFLVPAGRLVSIMSGGILFREDNKTREFRELLATLGGKITENPDGTFKTSGTSCKTVTVIIDMV